MKLYDVDKPVTYAIVIFLEYNIFGKFEKEFKLYRHHQRFSPKIKAVF